MKALIKYFSIIGIILFIFIFSKINIQQTFSIMINSNYLLLLLAFLVSAIEFVMRSAKWKKLVSIFDKRYGLKDAIQTYLIGFAFGAVTPSKAGDMVKIIDLRNRTGMEIKKCFSISVFDRIIDFSALIFTAMLCTLAATFVFSELNYILAPILFLIIVLFLLMLLGLTNYLKIMLKPFYYLIPSAFKSKAKEVFYSFREIIRISRKDSSFLAYVALSLLAWVISYSMPYFIALAVGLKVSVLHFLLLMPIVGIVELLPISLFGIGSRDLALIVIFSPLGLGKEEIISISMLILFISIVPKVLIGFLISWKQNVTLKKAS